MNTLNPIGYLLLQIGSVLESLCAIYGFILFLYILLNMLVQLQVLSAYKPLFRGVTLARILNFFSRWYEPPLNRIRKYVPNLGGLDLSPIVLFLAVQFAGYTIFWIFSRVALLVG